MAFAKSLIVGTYRPLWNSFRPFSRYFSISSSRSSSANFELNNATFEHLNSAGGFTTILPKRSVLRISGKDTIDYLQGMTTNNLQPFQSEEPPASIYTMFLSGPGRVLADVILHHQPSSEAQPALLIDCHGDSVTLLQSHLKKFKLRSKFQLEDVSDEYTIVAGLGLEDRLQLDPRFEHVRTKIPFPFPSVHREVVAKDTLRHASALNVDVPIDQAPLYHYWRTRMGLGEGPLDHIPNKALPLESNLEEFNGVDYFKGCYLGQELTARTHFTGTLRKRIVPVTSTQDLATILNGRHVTEVELRSPSGKRAGSVLSHIGDAGLALVRLQHLGDDGVLIIHDKPDSSDDESSKEAGQPLAEVKADMSLINGLFAPN
eukprot:TRINITY_DN8159_c0_g1_i2.p2 TRINITY_DN8159_c0_g1~~TRINITY_DN8159_c0_g1_i2.p2  ORF type:complete len:374 (+),score=65.75 TRINITY_DN8159_c0_g1_i2:147-1268(+)